MLLNIYIEAGVAHSVTSTIVASILTYQSISMLLNIYIEAGGAHRVTSVLCAGPSLPF